MVDSLRRSLLVVGRVASDTPITHDGSSSLYTPGLGPPSWTNVSLVCSRRSIDISHSAAQPASRATQRDTVTSVNGAIHRGCGVSKSSRMAQRGPNTPGVRTNPRHETVRIAGPPADHIANRQTAGVCERRGRARSPPRADWHARNLSPELPSHGRFAWCEGVCGYVRLVEGWRRHSPHSICRCLRGTFFRTKTPIVRIRTFGALPLSKMNSPQTARYWLVEGWGALPGILFAPDGRGASFQASP